MHITQEVSNVVHASNAGINRQINVSQADKNVLEWITE